jgi:hypothetical protein
MLSIYGSKTRIVQAHMSPKQQRLQVRYSKFFDFPNHTKEWLDICVRWFLNEPLAVLSPPYKLNLWENSESSDGEGESLVPAPAQGQTYISDGPRSPEQEGHTSEALPRPMCTPRCSAEEASLDQTMAKSSALLDAHSVVCTAVPGVVKKSFLTDW